MALIKCDECGREISEKATSCPSCGAPVATSVASSLGAKNLLTDVGKSSNPSHSIGKLLLIAVAALPLAYFVFGDSVRKAVKNSSSGSNTSQSSQPNIPSYDVSSVRALSKNERQELERRCLGVDHPTCTLLKSDSLKTMEDLDRAFCETKVAQIRSMGAMGGSLSQKCKDLLGRN